MRCVATNEAPRPLALKTCCWRTGAGHTFALCDPCYTPLAAAVWIVPGSSAVFGSCRSCGSWFSLWELRERSAGGKAGAPSGLCERCA